ncbi:hypothetical protein OIU84_025111 [Salix udensis]|uniref:Uncharacterized protein n=1 Tax=Salix udensis TaxID=889485 RepID=A0AAD6PC23_9ROSI|nr:hypothetical protein OIU84_025111 [Salix udensis]
MSTRSAQRSRRIQPRAQPSTSGYKLGRDPPVMLEHLPVVTTPIVAVTSQAAITPVGVRQDDKYSPPGLLSQVIAIALLLGMRGQALYTIAISHATTPRALR